MPLDTTTNTRRDLLLRAKDRLERIERHDRWGICEVCGKPRSRHASRFCSLACRTKASTMDLPVKFWAKVQKTDGCWLWIGPKKKYGYGAFHYGSRREGTATYILAPRMSWVLSNGPIPCGLFVCHHCDNPACVNPDHLFLGTAKDNAIDMTAKGRNYTPAVSQPGARNGNSRLTDEMVRAIRIDRRPQTVIAKELGIAHPTVNAIKRRRSWKHLPATREELLTAAWVKMHQISDHPRWDCVAQLMASEAAALLRAAGLHDLADECADEFGVDVAAVVKEIDRELIATTSA